MSGTVVGRDAVLARAWQALREPGWVLLEGPAGIGKTAVLRALVSQARAAGMLVVGCAPTEAETALPLAALADLLQPLVERGSPLPAPQRLAVQAALLADESGTPIDERALAAATRSLLQHAAGHAEAGVLLAVDDAPWLDPPSERALRFVLRRLSVPVAVLVSRRTSASGADPVPLELDRVEGLHRVALTPLGVGPLHHVLRGRFGVALSRPMVARLARDSGGNPLLAIELTRAILRLPQLPSAREDLPVPASLQDLVGASLAALSERSLSAVRFAALLSAPRLRALAAADVDPADFDAVEEVGLVTVGVDDRVRFVHPAHAAAVRASIPPGVRRRLHDRLAQVSADPDERARHLAWAVTSPSVAIAAELAAAGARARTRGAPEVAAEFYDRAAALAADSEDEYRLRLSAVHCRYDSGDYVAAGEQIESIAASLTADPLAEALLLRASIAFSADDPEVAVRAGERALAAATPGSRLAGRIHAHLGVFVDLPGPARAHAEAALRLLPDDGTVVAPAAAHAGQIREQGDRSLLASVLMLLFLSEVRAGATPRTELLERALELEAGEPSWLAGTIPAIWWKSNDDHARSVQRLTWMLEIAVASGDEPWQHELIAHLGETETLAGHYDAARCWIARARELGEQLGTGFASEIWLAGMLDVHVGELDAAQAAAEHGLQQAQHSGEPWARRINLQLAAFAALAAGRFAEAAGYYAELAGAVDETGLVEPLSTRYEADWVEACVGAGDLASAEVAFDRLQQRHTRLPRPWTSLGLARARVLVASAQGADTVALVEQLLAARAALAADTVPFDQARCLYAAGLAHRRARRKRQARDALLLAAAEFDDLGARSFAQRARADAARTGGRPAASQDLTSTEEQVAVLAASGRTNRAIAEELFISPKTVEANLARVYRKLGISSRAELGAVMAARPDRET